MTRLGYEVVERGYGKSLLSSLWKDHPDVVFNLPSIYAWEGTNLIPAILEIAGVRYTGSGMLGLSLARNDTKLFPLLLNSGIRVPAFVIIPAGSPASRGLHYPLTLYRDNLPRGLRLSSEPELVRAVNLCPESEEVCLQEQAPGERVSLFMLDQTTFLGAGGQPYRAIARKAYEVIEARGLARFDFVCSDEPLLEGVDVAPDPLDGAFLQAASSAGWDQEHVLQAMVNHACRDRSRSFEEC